VVRLPRVKLYVCWTTIQTPRPGGHPCHNAHEALRLAGYDPEVVKVHGLGIGPRFMHAMTDGRREVEELTGQRAVPVLVTDDGEVVTDSKRIVEWAEAHPAHLAGAGAGSGSEAGTASGT
jgi:Glutathione S-transferase, N-terminal domain